MFSFQEQLQYNLQMQGAQNQAYFQMQQAQPDPIDLYAQARLVSQVPNEYFMQVNSNQDLMHAYTAAGDYETAVQIRQNTPPTNQWELYELNPDMHWWERLTRLNQLHQVQAQTNWDVSPLSLRFGGIA